MKTEKIISENIGFGCGRIYGGLSKKKSFELIDVATRLGFKYFDTAPSYGYGSSEEVLGDFFNGDKNVVIVTKVGMSRPRYRNIKIIQRYYLSPLVRVLKNNKKRVEVKNKKINSNVIDIDFCKKSIDLSLKLLRKDVLDGALIHNPPYIDNIGEVNELLADLKQSRIVNKIGLGYNESAREDLYTNNIDIVQDRVDKNKVQVIENVSSVKHGLFRYYLNDFICTEHFVDQYGLDRSIVEYANDRNKCAGLLLALNVINNPQARYLISTNNAFRLAETIESFKIFYNELS